MITKKANSEEEIINLGIELGKKLQAGNVVAMKGTLGAGKTTMTKGIALGLGIEENVTSPTFTIISEYYGDTTLYHMDFYRIDSIDEFDLLGAEDLFYSDGVCVLEWYEKIQERMPDNYIKVNIIIEADNSRTIEITNLNI